MVLFFLCRSISVQQQGGERSVCERGGQDRGASAAVQAQLGGPHPVPDRLPPGRHRGLPGRGQGAGGKLLQVHENSHRDHSYVLQVIVRQIQVQIY